MADAAAALDLRRRELLRRMSPLQGEVADWSQRVLNVEEFKLHKSQIDALGELMNIYFTRQSALAAALEPAPPIGQYEQGLFDLASAVVAAQRAWSFFREKLDLRTAVNVKDNLRLADIVAIDCYDTVCRVALDKGFIANDAVREPPLTYLTPDFSPMTWPRGSRPNDGQSESLPGQKLPIPVIELPWDQIQNPWELLAIHHEVAHDIEADLGLRADLTSALKTQLQKQTDITPERQRRWAGWQSEILADLVAMQLGGPAFAEMLMNFLLLPADKVTTIVLGDEHPNHYLRIQLLVADIRIMAQQAIADPQFSTRLQAHATRIETLWSSLYAATDSLTPYMPDFPAVIGALMDTVLPSLGNQMTLRQLIPYASQHDADIRQAADIFAAGSQVTFPMAARHAAAAARLAASQVSGSDQKLASVAQNSGVLISKGAPVGLRRLPADFTAGPTARRARLERFVDAHLNTPQLSVPP